MDILGRLREYETWSEDWPIIKEAADEIERLREALQLMVDEQCDYMILNKLGDPEKQHTIKLARAALQQKDSK